MSKVKAITITAHMTPNEIFGPNTVANFYCDAFSKSISCQTNDLIAAKNAAKNAQQKSKRVDICLYFENENFIDMVFYTSEKETELQKNTIKAFGVSAEHPIVKEFIEHMTQKACA